jgi:hypothetical protein
MTFGGPFVIECALARPPRLLAVTRWRANSHPRKETTMNDSEIPVPSSDSPATRKRSPARRKPAARAKAVRPAAGGARRKSAPRSRSTARRGGDLQGLLQTLAKRASAARGRLASASDEGARATRKAWKKVSGVSRKTIDRLTVEWKQMDSARKAQFVAALLTALAAASAPIVRRGMKKR